LLRRIQRSVAANGEEKQGRALIIASLDITAPVKSVLQPF
jgi:hypothetical protein